jgi:site-specific DNA-cytosine methylase
VIRALDLCSGGGGWAVAARGLPIRIELAIDWWRPACMTYRLNHPATRVLQADLRELPLDVEAMAGTFDLVLGGIPCQWLSKYRTLNQAQDQELADQRRLLDAALSLVKRIGPRWWALEDTVQLIRELPLMTPYQVIDSAAFSPQRRKRVYVGEFPRPLSVMDRRVLGDCLLPGPHRVGQRLFGRTPQDGRRGFAADRTLGAFPDRKGPTVANYGSRHEGECGVVDERLGELRQLDWREAALLQGYPENYLFYGSQTEAWQMVANSVQIDTARAILQAIVADAIKSPAEATEEAPWPPANFAATGSTTTCLESTGAQTAKARD